MFTLLPLGIPKIELIFQMESCPNSPVYAVIYEENLANSPKDLFHNLKDASKFANSPEGKANGSFLLLSILIVTFSRCTVQKVQHIGRGCQLLVLRRLSTLTTSRFSVGVCPFPKMSKIQTDCE